MNSISLNCKLSLSKKIRAIFPYKHNDQESSISLVITAPLIVDGKGLCKLSISSEHFEEYPPDILNLIGETSLQIEPFEILTETPDNSTATQGAIFITIPRKGVREAVVDKIAAVHAPEKEDVPHAVVPKESIKTPNGFSELDQPECEEWISNMEEFIEAINASKNKKSEIDVDNASSDRERAVLEEQKEREEGLDTPAWIVNDKVASLMINDLDLSLKLNAPLDLSNISAKKISYSRDLKEALKYGMVKFLSPREIRLYAEKSLDVAKTPDIEVFSSHEEAESNMAGSIGINPVIDEENSIEVADGDGLTEEEDMILNLTQNMPTVKSPRPTPSTSDSPAGSRRTVHGSTIESPKSPSIKPIKKL